MSEHQRWRRLFVGSVLLALGAAGLGAPPAQANVIWQTEQAMIDDSSNARTTFIYDPGVTHTISYEQFASGTLAAFYRSHGFDQNFLTWAPISLVNAPNETWNGCELGGNHGGLCPADQIVPAAPETVAAQFGPGAQIHVKTWGGAFIGVVCGNWNHAAAGPVPRITGTKYEDLNGDGVREAGEPGLPGWTINLSYNGSPVASTTTAADGSYVFNLDADHLPIGAGTYTLSETPQPEWVQSQGAAPVTVELGAGAATYDHEDFGNWRPATISGRKFDDHAVDGSGLGDPGLPGWTITLDNGATQTTGSDGTYAFAGLKPGVYTVGEVQQSGWRQTAPTTGTSTVTVTSGEILDNTDFGNVCTGQVQVTVPDGVGVLLDEVNVPGILTNDPSLPRSGTGSTTMAGLLPGTYRLTLTLPDGLFTTDPGLTAVDGGFAIVKSVDVTECGTTTYAPTFVASQPGKITGGVRLAVPNGFATGGFEFMQNSDGPRGTLEFNDHVSGLKIHTSDITGISTSGNEAYIFGHAAVDATTYSFRLHLVDAGEPGTSDRFELIVSNGYSAGLSETIDDGNIQMH